MISVYECRLNTNIQNTHTIRPIKHICCLRGIRQEVIKMKKTMLKNMLKSVIIYILISVINLVIYVFTYPETPLFVLYPNIFYVGTILNIAISIIVYSLAGRFMQTSGKKIKDLVSLSIPAILGSVFLIIGIIIGTTTNGHILFFMIVCNISCGFFINLCIGYCIPFAFIISLLPTAIMFLALQVRHKND